MSQRYSEEEANLFGFRWDQVDVVRAAEFEGAKRLFIDTEFGRMTIAVSPTGRSIRAFKNGKELK